MADTQAKNLKNDDFRKLLATPAGGTSGSSHSSSSASHSFTHRKAAPVVQKSKPKKFFAPRDKAKKEENEEDSIFNESQAKLNEILQKYRDRAGERRKGLVQGDDAELRAKLTAAYKAVPGSAKAAASAAERRRMEIQESKYLGGDMEHTHLVKGLDYSLLNKVRTEIDDNDERDELEQVYELDKKSQQPPDQVSTNKLVRNMCRTLFQTELPVRNEMFSKGRMAYVVELDDEEEDVPSTLMRSVVDNRLDQTSENINADNLLINKLTQVLSYLRTDLKKRKRGDGDRPADDGKLKIYDDVDDDYVPSKARESSSKSSHGERKEKTSYFESSVSDSRDRGDRGDRSRKDRDRDYDRDRDDRRGGDRDRSDRHSDYRRSENKRRAEDIQEVKPETSSKDAESRLKRRRMEEEDDAYAELYPGGIGLLDAAGGESDEEADFSKMDMGNKKGPVKRWDFDNEKDFEDYQESREAMPKAAYQYGVKMNGGRKTRKNAVIAGEKKIDRELDKINKILDTRKSKGSDSKRH